MRIHLIAIGGAIMHNLALDLLKSGNHVSGSDDEIYDPARTRLNEANILPAEGWDADRITPDIDLIILGMHAKKDNPELARAQALGLKIVSFPEYVGMVSSGKKRIVIAGSHGKTSTTSMVMHVLRDQGINFDYLVGAAIEGFEKMVKLSDSKVIVIEGDEYLSSSIDRQPKFNHYDPDVIVITGVHWDHINVFPTLQDYHAQFSNLIARLKKESVLYYFGEDDFLIESSKLSPGKSQPYHAIEHEVKDEGAEIIAEGRGYPIAIFGKHNMENLSAAQLVCQEVGIAKKDFLKSIVSFSGASKRLEKIFESDQLVSYRDYAHAPSKLRATLNAVRSRHPKSYIWTIYELHTYSSLNKEFIAHYEDCLLHSDCSIVYFDQKTLAIKNMPPLKAQDIQDGFGDSNIAVASSIEELEDLFERWHPESGRKNILLWLSSGQFGGMDYKDKTENFLT